MEVRILGDLSPESAAGKEWETLVASNPSSGMMQSLHWSSFKRKQGLRALHLGLYQFEKLIGGALFYTAARNRGAGFLVAPEGPVLPWNNQPLSSEGLKLLVRAAEGSAAEYDVMAVRIEPRLPPPVPDSMRGFGRAPVNLIPRETLYLDLTESEEDLLLSLKPKCRYNIRLAQRHGVKICQDTTVEAIKRFYPMLREASCRDNFPIEPLPHFAVLAETLCPPGLARFIFAEHEGDTLGALLLTSFGERGTYLYGGISNRKRNLMAGYAMQWAAIVTAKSLGCRTYDMFGFDQFGSPYNNYARFSRFKRQFGGTVMRIMGGHDYFFLDSLADVVIKAINEIPHTDKPSPKSSSERTVQPEKHLPSANANSSLISSYSS
jgi:lipid II:glycine glycyltransferase (peptidoglycan interpeptide bridge formation enzyme)